MKSRIILRGFAVLLGVLGWSCGAGDNSIPGDSPGDAWVGDPCLSGDSGLVGDPGAVESFLVELTGTTVVADEGNVTLIFPPGAVPEDMLITVEPLYDYPAHPGLIAERVYEFGPDGTQFDRPIQLVITYESSQVDPNVDETKLRLLKVIDGTWRRILGGEIDIDAKVVTASIRSFSAHGLGPFAGTGNTILVSVASDATQGGNHSNSPALNSDGRYVAFSSLAVNLVASDTNNLEDVFVHDRDADANNWLDEGAGNIATVRVSIKSDGTQSVGGFSGYPSLSDDGRYVAFVSEATNLVADDNNNLEDVFVHDRDADNDSIFDETDAGARTTTRVSVDATASDANDLSMQASISANGQYVVFASAATDLVAGDSSTNPDIFIRNLLTNTTERVSVADDESEANGASFSPSVSSDGRYVAFISGATNLVADDTNGVTDIFVRDRTAQTTTRVSVNSGGTEADGPSDLPVISDNGAYVAFASVATNLVGGDDNDKTDIFAHDLASGATVRLSVDSNGNQTNGTSYGVDISSDGRYVVFHSDAAPPEALVAGDNNGVLDVFFHDRDEDADSTFDEQAEAGGIATTRVSVTTGGGEGSAESGIPALSSDATQVAFVSSATDLVTTPQADTNSADDIFVHDPP